MPHRGHNIHIPLTEAEAITLLGRVQPTEEMPRQGAHAMKAKPKRKRAKARRTKAPK